MTSRSLRHRALRHRALRHRALRRNTTRSETNRSGVAMVELALVLPILFVVIFGSVEFSRLNMLKHLANVAAYEGARAGIVIGATSTEVSNKATTILNAGGVVNPTITVTPSTITEGATQVQVNISIPVAGNFWITPDYVNSAITGSCTLRTERQGN